MKKGKSVYIKNNELKMLQMMISNEEQRYVPDEWTEEEEKEYYNTLQSLKKKTDETDEIGECWYHGK